MQCVRGTAHRGRKKHRTPEGEGLNDHSLYSCCVGARGMIVNCVFLNAPQYATLLFSLRFVPSPPSSITISSCSSYNASSCQRLPIHTQLQPTTSLVGVRKTAGCPADIACAQRVLHRCTAVRHHCTAQLARLEVLQLAGGVVPAAANFARAVSERAVFRHTLCLASHHTRCASRHITHA
eukprot:111765-Chlamydomonas_euryale.AAC.1